MSDFKKGLKKTFFLVLAFLFLVSEAPRLTAVASFIAGVRLSESRAISIHHRFHRWGFLARGNISYAYPDALRIPIGQKGAQVRMQRLSDLIEKGLGQDYEVNYGIYDRAGRIPLGEKEIFTRMQTVFDKPIRGAASIDGYIDADTHNKLNSWLAKKFKEADRPERDYALENKLGLSGIMEIYIVSNMLEETGVIGHYGIRKMAMYLDKTAYLRLGEDLFYHELTEYAILIQWVLKSSDGSLKPDIKRLCDNYDLMLKKDPEKAIQFLREAKKLPELSMILEELVEWLDRTGGATDVNYVLKVIHEKAYPIKDKYADFLRYAARVEKHINPSLLPEYWNCKDMAEFREYLYSLANDENVKGFIGIELEKQGALGIFQPLHGIEYNIRVSYTDKNGSRKGRFFPEIYKIAPPRSRYDFIPYDIGSFMRAWGNNEYHHPHITLSKDISRYGIDEVLLEAAGYSEKHIDLDTARPARGAAGPSVPGKGRNQANNTYTPEAKLAEIFKNVEAAGTTALIYDALIPYVRPGKKVTVTEMIEMLRKKDVVDFDTGKRISLDSPKVIAAIKLILKDRGLFLEEGGKPEVGEIEKEAQNSIVDRSVISDRARNAGGETAGEVYKSLIEVKEEARKRGVKIKGVRFAGQLQHVYSLDEAIKRMREEAEDGSASPYETVRNYMSAIRLGIEDFEIYISGLGIETIRIREIYRERNAIKAVNNNL